MIRRAKIERLRNYLSLRQKYLTNRGEADPTKDSIFEQLGNEFSNIDAVLAFMLDTNESLLEKNLELETMNSKFSAALAATTEALESYRVLIRKRSYDNT